MISFTFHRFGESFRAHGTEADARLFLDRLNHDLRSNFWTMQRLPITKALGRNIAAELAKLDPTNGSWNVIAILAAGCRTLHRIRWTPPATADPTPTRPDPTRARYQPPLRNGEHER